MTIKAILQHKGSAVFSIGSAATLAEAAATLADKRIGAVVIVDGEQLVGILSERDVVRRVGERGPSALEETVADTMTKRVEVCSLEDSIGSVMQRMTQSRFRHMPVVEDGRLLGIISIGDVVKERIDEAERERDDMRNYILNG